MHSLGLGHPLLGLALSLADGLAGLLFALLGVALQLGYRRILTLGGVGQRLIGAGGFSGLLAGQFQPGLIKGLSGSGAGGGNQRDANRHGHPAIGGGDQVE